MYRDDIVQASQDINYTTQVTSSLIYFHCTMLFPCSNVTAWPERGCHACIIRAGYREGVICVVMAVSVVFGMTIPISLYNFVCVPFLLCMHVDLASFNSSLWYICVRDENERRGLSTTTFKIGG